MGASSTPSTPTPGSCMGGRSPATAASCRRRWPPACPPASPALPRGEPSAPGVVLERLPEGRPPAVQQDPLVLRRDPERLARLLARQSLHVAQGDDDSLPRWQRGQGGPQQAQRLTGQDPALRLAFPLHGSSRRRPAAGVAVVRTAEPVRVDRRAVVLACQAG